MAYAKCLFKNEEVIEKADMFGLTSIENEDLTMAGLIAKMIVWDEAHHGVEAYIYDMTKKQIEDMGGYMPESIRRITEDENCQ